jgi:hypothetical protein
MQLPQGPNRSAEESWQLADGRQPSPLAILEPGDGRSAVSNADFSDGYHNLFLGVMYNIHCPLSGACSEDGREIAK